MVSTIQGVNDYTSCFNRGVGLVGENSLITQVHNGIQKNTWCFTIHISKVKKSALIYAGVLYNPSSTPVSTISCDHFAKGIVSDLVIL